MSLPARVAARIGAIFATMLSPDGRRAWALIALVGGCAIFTAMAAFAMHLLRAEARLVFWLGLAAHAQVLVGMTAIGALLVKRSLRLSRDGIEISDGQVHAEGCSDAPRQS
ncbi:MAG: hypothetical protein ACK40C_09400 [Novosphingobium meiothermophilum]